MKLSDQVISLKQAKKLKELGFEKESYFMFDELGAIEERYFRGHLNNSSENRVPTYTASELMEIIGPCKVLHCSMPKGTIYQVSYKRTDEEGVIYKGTSKNLAQALGDMLIYLLEKGYIKNI